ncbi:hypothetical protein E1B28_003538 [Marasmius oreades]|uniref:Uncharacterized protein n=1 Tax=Marasmius oreades TaxID=181124 RepID=A0A9P7RMQ8_9AGAR|nr:uncharacterized protein E1B28_003538 [Marasmius oreades]KAG7086016.1 hypothetical protein E1B28_003538 [Marasmius oreades]
MAPPTKAQIADLITRYIEYARHDATPDNKLIIDIVKAYRSFPNGDWEYDGETPGKSVVSCFQGITFICWKFSSINKSANAVDAATLYKDLTKRNYNVWVSMDPGRKKTDFASDCSTLTDTDTLNDYRSITWDEQDQRRKICKAAISVTSGFYGTGTSQTIRSENLWNKRVLEQPE